MKNDTFKTLGGLLLVLAVWASCFFWIPSLIGKNGFFGNFFETGTTLKLLAIWILTAHLTITAMSLAFHRSHTHHAVKLHPAVDYSMQTFLWAITSMSKLDWVSVHVYHHTYSDTEKDAHSPKQKGLLHVFFFGAYDYTKAKNWPEVLKIRKRIPANRYERYIAENTMLAPVILTLGLMLAFGPLYGTLLGLLNFSISPLFAVGGVNALAHAIGYQNYDSKDESRNLGFLFLLNWIICGELDHNNHHRFPKSPGFSHRWFEFDIGWVYLRLMQSLKLAKITGTMPKYQGHETRDVSESQVAFVS